MSKKSYSHMSEQEYKDIKMLTGSPMSKKRISRIVKRSMSTVYYIDKSTDYEDYRRLQAEKNERSATKAKQKVEVEDQSETTKVDVKTQTRGLDAVVDKALDELSPEELRTVRKNLQYLLDAVLDYEDAQREVIKPKSPFEYFTRRSN